MKFFRYLGSLAFVVGLFTVLFIGMPWYVTVVEDPVLPWWFRTAVFCLLGGIFVVLLSVALEQWLHKTPTDDTPSVKYDDTTFLLNTETVPGRVVTETLGLVQGHTVYAIWLGKDLSAVIRLILGGELTEYTEMMGKAREIATSRMLTQAAEMGADAIVNVRYMTTSVVGSAAELFAYGTAVRFSE